MNWVDALMLAIVAFSTLAGFLRGFARELLGLIAWIVAAVLAGRLSSKLTPMTQSWIQDPLIGEVVRFTVVFIIILIALSLLAGVLSRTVRFSLLGGVDRALGALFGLARGAALLVLSYVVLASVLPPASWPRPIRQARALPYLHTGAHLALTQVRPRWRPALPIKTEAGSGQESF